MALTNYLFDPNIDSEYARVDWDSGSFAPETQHIFESDCVSHFYLLFYSEKTHKYHLLDTYSQEFVPGNVIGYIIEDDSHILIIADKSDSNRASKINLRTYNYEKKQFNDKVDYEILSQMCPINEEILFELMGFSEKDNSCQKKSKR